MLSDNLCPVGLIMLISPSYRTLSPVLSTDIVCFIGLSSVSPYLCPVICMKVLIMSVL